MEDIITIEDLRRSLDLRDVPAEQLQERFKKIADALLTKFAIKKGEDWFYITDIEFYYYSNNYKDFITYPRKCNAGEWFFHPSGVDIAFASYIKFDKNNKYKPILNSEVKFGGILIRSIEPENTELEVDPKRLIDHPLNVSDFLFDHFDAYDVKKDDRFPVLTPKPNHKYKAKQLDVTRRDIKKIQDPENTDKNATKNEKIIEKKTNRKKKFEDIWKSYSHKDIDKNNLEAYKNKLEQEFNKYLSGTESDTKSAELRYKLNLEKK